MRIDAIAIGNNPPRDVNVIIEVPIGGEPIKYEMNKTAGTLFVDRFLHTPMRYPGNYGFVPQGMSRLLLKLMRRASPGCELTQRLRLAQGRAVGRGLMRSERGSEHRQLLV